MKTRRIVAQFIVDVERSAERQKQTCSSNTYTDSTQAQKEYASWLRKKNLTPGLEKPQGLENS